MGKLSKLRALLAGILSDRLYRERKDEGFMVFGISRQAALTDCA